MPFTTLDDLPAREMWPGFLGRMIHAENMTLAFWAVADGGVVPEHAHPHEQVLVMLEGEFELTLEGETHALSPGTVLVIPPNARHSGRALGSCRILDVFYPVREDYR